MYFLSSPTFALSPINISNSMGRTLPKRKEVRALGDKTFLAKHGPGKINFNYMPSEFEGKCPAVHDIKVVTTPSTEWKKNPLLQKTNIIEALEYFRDNEADVNSGTLKEKLHITLGSVPYDKEKGELPIALIEKSGDNFTLVIDEEFSEMWQRLRSNDIFLEALLPDPNNPERSQKRIVSIAWAIFYRIAKHEMADLRQFDGSFDPKGGGHLFVESKKNKILLRPDEMKANEIGGRYARINDAIWLWFLGAYSFNDATRYSNTILERRLNWFFDDKEAIRMQLPEEFPLLKDNIKLRKEAIDIALLVNYHSYNFKKEITVEEVPIEAPYSIENRINNLKEISNIVRYDICQMLFNAESGHPGGSLSLAEILTTLYFGEVLNYDPRDPDWANRDRVVLSKGHGVPALYAVLAEAGFFPKDDFARLRRSPSSPLQGHPDQRSTSGIDVSPGALGQGFSNACGMAAAAKLLGKKMHFWSILGGGEEQEGQISEAARHAVALGLSNQTVIIDDNGLQIEGAQHDVDKANVAGVWREYGWNVIEVDGHAPGELLDAMLLAKQDISSKKPTCIIAKTIKGKGVSLYSKDTETSTRSHSYVPRDLKIQAQALEELRNVISKYSSKKIVKFIKNARISQAKKRDIDRINNTEELPLPLPQTTYLIPKIGTLESTKQSFGKALEYLGSRYRNIVAMSADLQGSCNMNGFETLFGMMSLNNPKGRYIPLGIREAHGASFAAGMTHLGIKPVIGTYDIFNLHMVPQIRSAILNQAPVIFIGAFSGFGIGKDGATHHSTETPGVMDILSGPLGDKMDIYEPADAEETKVIMELAARSEKPVYVRLTIQDLPVFDKSSIKNYEQCVEEGSYVLSDPGKGNNDLIMVSAGAMTFRALAASQQLKKQGYKVKVVNIVSINKIDNENNPFQGYLEDNTPILSLVDANSKVLENPILRASNKARKSLGINPGLVYSKGIAIIGSASPEDLYQLNELDSSAIKTTAEKILKNMKKTTGSLSPAAIPAVVSNNTDIELYKIISRYTLNIGKTEGPGVSLSEEEKTTIWHVINLLNKEKIEIFLPQEMNPEKQINQTIISMQSRGISIKIKRYATPEGRSAEKLIRKLKEATVDKNTKRIVIISPTVGMDISSYMTDGISINDAEYFRNVRFLNLVIPKSWESPQQETLFHTQVLMRAILARLLEKDQKYFLEMKVLLEEMLEGSFSSDNTDANIFISNLLKADKINKNPSDIFDRVKYFLDKENAMSLIKKLTTELDMLKTFWIYA